MAEFALLDELFPDLAGILIGRLDGDDAGVAALAERTAAEAGLLVEARQFQAFLERFESLFEILRREFIWNSGDILLNSVCTAHPTGCPWPPR